MPVTLPTDGDGKLVPFSLSAINAMDIRRRGVKNDDHVQYTFGPNGSSCRRKFSCAWAERFNALIYLVGACQSYIDPDSGVRKLSRLVPLTDPDFPAWICTQAEINPYGFTGEIDPDVVGSQPYPEFDRAEINCTFELVPFDVHTDDETATETDRYVTWPGYPGAEISADASQIGLPGSTLQYVTSDGTTATGPAGTSIPYPVGFTEGASKLKVTWRRVPFDVWGPASALFLRLIGTESTRGYIGSVNQTVFRGYPELSLLLMGIEQRLLPDPTGLGYSWDLSYIMASKVAPYGHLGFYFHDTKTVGSRSGYYQALRPAAGTTTKAPAALGTEDSLFPVKEFANLFNPGV